jgi:drug/metabolite transporter (DMT)-like permease
MLAEWILLAVPGLIWGCSFLLIAIGLEALPPDGVSFLRFAVGFAALACVPAARRPVRKQDRAGVAWLGLLWLALPMSMFPHAERHVSSAVTGMLNGAIPVLAAVIAALLARRAPSPATAAALAVGCAGAVLMAWPEASAGGSSALGVGLIAVALVSYGIAINLARPLQQRNGALPVVWRALGVALVATAPLGLPALRHARWSAEGLAAVLALGAFGTAAANVVMAVAAGRLGATRASGTAFLIPVVALALGVLVRDERVTPIALAGGATCLLGAWMLRRAPAPAGT